MFISVCLSYVLFSVLGCFLLVLCKKNTHPSLKGEPITPLPGNTDSVYYCLPNKPGAASKPSAEEKKPEKGSAEGVKSAQKTPKKEGESKEAVEQKPEKTEQTQKSVLKEDKSGAKPEKSEQKPVSKAETIKSKVDTEKKN